MLFQTQGFLLVFLPVTLVLWYGAAHRPVLRDCLLVVCSFVFYGWWDVRFLPLLAGEILLSYGAAQLYFARPERRRPLLYVAIAANLSVLFFFKYSSFAAANFAALLGVPAPAMSIILPIGISFFTFEIVSYLADVARGQAPNYPFRHFCLFVALFPRLIAGPIVRHHEIIPQFGLNPLRDGAAERISKGAVWLSVGLAKKLWLADALAPVADAQFVAAAHGPLSFGAAWSGALAFSLQLFLDFSAYSEMAIGIALMLGFTLPQNFNAPYRALDLKDFWRRWHMTLSRYLRDYVYIPLGGSRAGEARYLGAVLFTMALCGLWHGAGWTFVAWGLMHGAGLVVVHVWQRAGRTLPDALSWGVTMLFVVAGWVLFRATDFASAGRMLEGMAGLNGLTGRLNSPTLLAAGAAVALFGPTTNDVVNDLLKPARAAAFATALALVVAVLKAGEGQPQDFIYFQF